MTRRHHLNWVAPEANPTDNFRWIGADEGNRTPNLLITNQLLYRLSYVSQRIEVNGWNDKIKPMRVNRLISLLV
jgi:hypothetical protein